MDKWGISNKANVIVSAPVVINPLPPLSIAAPTPATQNVLSTNTAVISDNGASGGSGNSYTSG